MLPGAVDRKLSISCIEIIRKQIHGLAEVEWMMKNAAFWNVEP
jgi:hypothetical protein